MVPLEAYPHVTQDCSLREALNALGGAHIEMHGETSLPRILLVFDSEETLLGLVRRRDILRGLSPRWFFKAEPDHPEAVFDVDMDENISDVMADKVIPRFRARAENSIEEYVQPIAGVVDPECSLIRLVNIMVKQGYHMLPVIDKERVIGVVRSVEVLWAVNQLLSGTEQTQGD
ncbi:MAG: CBS domain-containing protein [Xanthomonadales bacterium]|nr:CBS domain-containing protein [Xanthomonadales bacterium]